MLLSTSEKPKPRGEDQVHPKRQRKVELGLCSKLEEAHSLAAKKKPTSRAVAASEAAAKPAAPSKCTSNVKDGTLKNGQGIPNPVPLRVLREHPKSP